MHRHTPNFAIRVYISDKFKTQGTVVSTNGDKEEGAYVKSESDTYERGRKKGREWKRAREKNARVNLVKESLRIYSTAALPDRGFALLADRCCPDTQHACLNKLLTSGIWYSGSCIGISLVFVEKEKYSGFFFRILPPMITDQMWLTNHGQLMRQYCISLFCHISLARLCYNYVAI